MKLTVLSVSKNQRLAKTIGKDSIRDYSNAKFFRVTEREFTDVSSLYDILKELAKSPRKAVIRGAYQAKPELTDLYDHEGKVRRKLELFPDKPVFFLMFDVDSATDATPEEWIKNNLPAPFQGITYIHHHSSSSGIKSGLRAHIWFVLTTPYTGAQLKAWAQSIELKADLRMFNPVQLHYTANPVFAKGVADPIDERLQLVEGWAGDAVELVVDDDIVADVALKESKKDQEYPKAQEFNGVEGAFCQVYDVYRAINEYLGDAFSYQFEAGGKRLNFLKSASGMAGGAFIADEDDRWVVNVHAGDPFEGKAQNVYQLVKEYCFDGKDGWAEEIPEVKKVLLERITGDFEATDLDLTFDDDGQIINNYENVYSIIKYHFNGKIGYNDFTGDSITIIKDLPWRQAPRLWSDEDDLMLAHFIFDTYQFKPSRTMVGEVVVVVAEDHHFHPVRDKLDVLVWDGTPRLNKIASQYLHDEDNPYTNAAIRKTMAAAVARVIDPGIKFDCMLVLRGGQGIRKSSFFKKLAFGDEWFTDGVSHLDGKTEVEQMKGKWICEISELQGFSRAEVNHVKSFLSRSTDRARMAYARHAKDYPRQSIVVGSTNDLEFLKDDTGHRRWWPLECGDIPIDIDALDVEQLWAEAKRYYEQGETLFMDDPQTLAILAMRHNTHEVSNELTGLISSWLNQPIPEDHYDNEFPESEETIYRNKVCIAEIWCECLGKTIDSITQTKRNEISRALRQVPGWSDKPDSMRSYRQYGRQKTFSRLDNVIPFNKQNHLQP